MRKSAPNEMSHFPTATGGISRLAFAKLRSAGVPTEPLLSNAGLTLDEMRDPNRRIKVRDQIRFLNLASRALKDDFLGFDLALQVDLRELGLLYYVLASSAKFERSAGTGDALQ